MKPESLFTDVDRKALGRVMDALQGRVLRYQEEIREHERAIERLRREERATLDEAAVVRKAWG